MPNTLTSIAGVVDLDVLGMDAAPIASPYRTVDHEYTDGSFLSVYLGQSPPTRALTGIYSPVKPDYVIGPWDPQAEWDRLEANPGSVWTFSDDGVAYLITGLNADRRQYVNTDPYLVAWRIDLKRQRPAAPEATPIV